MHTQTSQLDDISVLNKAKSWKTLKIIDKMNDWNSEICSDYTSSTMQAQAVSISPL